MIKKNKNSNSAKKAAENSAQHLANLLQRNVAGFDPEPILDQGPSPDEIVEGLISGRLKPAPFDGTDPTEIWFSTDAPFIVISGLMNGSQEVREQILEKVTEFIFRDKFLGKIFYELRLIAQNREMTPENIDSIRKRIPEIWKASRSHTLEGPMKAGIFYRWYQMLTWQCDDRIVDNAISYITSNYDPRIM